MVELNSEEELDRLLTPFVKGEYISNSYFLKDGYLELIKKGVLYYHIQEENLVLLEKRLQGEFYELFFFISNLDKPVKLNSSVPLVMEIPYRGKKFYPLKELSYWELSGFSEHIKRGLFSAQAKNITLSNSFLWNEIDYSIISDATEASVILNQIEKSFDKFTGDMLEVEDVLHSIENGEIVGAYHNDELAGFLKFYNKKNISWIGHVVIISKFRGKGIGKQMMEYYLRHQIQSGIKVFQQWVVEDNLPALKLYEGFGFKYINKNTVSLLKQ
ncbi:MAG: GNAT family N-acetyltransferase [Bacteroidia bacterium]